MVRYRQERSTSLASGSGGLESESMGLFSIVLLVAALLLVAGAEWPRFGPRFGLEARRRRDRAKRKSQLKLLKTESDEFAEAVQRDLENLPTIEPDRKP